MKSKIMAMAAFLGMLTIILGAFGAHALKEKLDAESMQSFETGVRYMMYHVLAVLLIQNSALLTEKVKNKISLLFFTGIIFFSGSIFVIALDLIPAGAIWFVTPLGGLFFILGWLMAGITFFKSGDKNRK
ncbi:DUF423 domain-containing protein [Lutimonas vermicola]|uniref:DUF423 domain-containing protein n=1 Tax=Lutimonas vermicola TaxID=414288 RepID=A0ABU9KZF9_9FLAO